MFQTSLILRYVEKEISLKKERLKCYNGGGNVKIYIIIGIDIRKCRGQGYDGARVMIGYYSRVQKRVPKRYRNIYIHCEVYNLNLLKKTEVFFLQIHRSFLIQILNAENESRFALLNSLRVATEKLEKS